MKQLALALLGAMLLASCATSNRITYLNPVNPDSLKPFTVDLAAYEEKYSKYDGVFLNSEYTLEHSGSQSEWAFTKVGKLRFLVLNPDAEWLTTFNFDENPGEELREVYIHVTSPDGTVKAYGANDLKVEKTGDRTRSFKFAYPDIRKGSIVEEGYEASLPATYDNLDQDIPLEYGVPVEQLSFRFAYPSWWRTRVKNIAPSRTLGHKEIYDEENNKVILAYEAKDVPAMPSEPYAPFFKEVANYMQVMVTSMQMLTPYTSYYDWKQLARGFARYAIDKESFWLGRVESTVEEVTKDRSSDFDKLDAIISYVQQNIKPGRSDPDDNFADVIKKGEGNFYLVNGLTRAMLEEANIRSNIVLIHDARDGYFDMAYVSPDQLYLPAVTAVIDGTTYVVFPYMKNLPTGLVPDHFQGQKALIISKEGFEGFMDIPDGKVIDNTVDDNYTLTIDDEGKISVVEEKTLHGSNAYSLRSSLEKVKAEDMEKEMKDLLTYTEGDVKMTKYEVRNQNDYRKPLVLRLEYTIDNLVTVTPEEVIFQTGGLFSPSTIRKYKVDTEERQLPIRIYYDETLNKSITIRHPANWSLSTELKPVAHENMFGSIKGNSQTSPGELKITQVRTLKKASEPKEKADELLDVTGRKSQLYIPTLVFNVGQQP